MKKTLLYLFILALACTGCFKDYNERFLLEDQYIEFEDAVPNSKLSGKNYPLLPALNQSSGIVRYRVNMTGRQSDQDIQLSFSVVQKETTSKEGIDYELPNGNSFVIPKNSSFGYVELEVLPTGVGSTRLVLELVNNGNVQVMKNYNTIGIPIQFPSISPDPSTIETINDLVYYKEITAGSYNNTSIGSFVDLKTGVVYNNAGGTMQPDRIDLNFQNSVSTAANFMTPAGPGIIAFGNPIRDVVAAWPVKNEGQYIKFSNTTAQEQADFEALTTKASLETAWQQAAATVSSRPGYSLTADGPSDRVRSILANDIIFFHSVTRNFYAVIKVKETVTGGAGTLTMSVKVAQ